MTGVFVVISSTSTILSAGSARNPFFKPQLVISTTSIHSVQAPGEILVSKK